MGEPTAELEKGGQVAGAFDLNSKYMREPTGELEEGGQVAGVFDLTSEHMREPMGELEEGMLPGLLILTVSQILKTNSWLCCLQCPGNMPRLYLLEVGKYVIGKCPGNMPRLASLKGWEVWEVCNRQMPQQHAPLTSLR